MNRTNVWVMRKCFGLNIPDKYGFLDFIIRICILLIDFIVVFVSCFSFLLWVLISAESIRPSQVSSPCKEMPGDMILQFVFVADQLTSTEYSRFNEFLFSSSFNVSILRLLCPFFSTPVVRGSLSVHLLYVCPFASIAHTHLKIKLKPELHLLLPGIEARTTI